MFRMGAVLDGEKYLAPQEAGMYLGVNSKKLCRWARQGRIPAIAMNEGKRKMWRFQIRDLGDAGRIED